MRIATALFLVSASISVTAQDVPPRPADVFEVASVKLNKDGGPVAGLRRIPGGRFEATNIQLDALISFAHQRQPFELQGGPDWLTTDRWDFLAKIDGDPGRKLESARLPDACHGRRPCRTAGRFVRRAPVSGAPFSSRSGGRCDRSRCHRAAVVGCSTRGVVSAGFVQQEPGTGCCLD